VQIHVTKPLFAWGELEDSPSLVTLRNLLATLPDGPLLEDLRLARGKGRNDYPVSTLWGVVILTIALRHTTTEACLAELGRNPALRQLIGIEHEDGVPKKWNVSRFLDVLGSEPHLTRLHEVFSVLITRLGQAVPDLGRDLAGDATSLNARRKRAGEAVEAETQAGLPQPSGGRKEYTDDTGKVTKVYEWNGYKLHLTACVKHEVALGYVVTSASAGDGETLPALLTQTQANLPPGRIQTLAYDKAADSNAVHELLHEAQIKPLIQIRRLWKEEQERMLPGHDGHSNIVYDEAGTLHCYDRVSEPMVRHQMAYLGHEADRGTLKYRCPAVHEGWPCPSQSVCNAGREYGKTVRVKREIDLRRFPPIPRATKQFEEEYKGRTAIERVNGRLKVFWGADDGNIHGATRFHAFVGCVMAVHAAFATLLASAPRREGTLGKLRLGPIAKLLTARSRTPSTA
jgi:hypothetical protein